MNCLAKVFLITFSIFLLSFECEAIVGGRDSLQPPIDEPVVFVNRHGKTARILGIRDEKRYIFKGLRYAQPPVGELRFQRPRMYTLEGDINATKFGPACPQLKPGSKGTANSTIEIIGKEDCLFINVFTPELPNGDEGLPVVVWIHGGGFRVGSAAQYDAKYLAQKRLVIVTMQYRLGSLGFLSTGNKEQPGNAGMFDIALALRWVRDYIHFFGGNTRKVIVMGQGSGGSAAVLVGMSDMTKGYTHGIVAMSGTSLSHWTLDRQPERTARSLSTAQTCSNNNHVKMVKCLQKKSPEEIIQADLFVEDTHKSEEDIASELSGLKSAGPVDEGEYDNRGLPSFVPREPIDTIKSNNFNRIPLMTGVTMEETTSAIHGNKKLNLHEKLKKNPEYLQTKLFNSLKSVISLIKRNFKQLTNSSMSEKLPTMVKKREKRQILSKFFDAVFPVQFQNYLKIKNPESENELLSKATEVTGDALFNFPAFLTASLWSKSNIPTYLYRYEHKGNISTGHFFLSDNPLVDNTGNIEGVGHGDDLSSVGFTPQTFEGEPIVEFEQHISEEDEKVRDTFTDLISEFAHNIHLSRHKRSPNSLLKEFEERESNYISIKPKPEVVSGFRFCQMALWGGFAERLQTSTCKFLSIAGKKIKEVKENIGKTVKSVKENIGGTMKEVKENIEDRMKGVKEIIGDKMKAAKENIEDKMKGVKESIGDKMKGVKENIEGKMKDDKGNIGETMQEVKENIGSTSKKTVGFLTRFSNQARSGFGFLS